MPHPGLKVSNKFDGDLNRLESDFVVALNELVKSIFSKNNLKSKTVNGERLILLKIFLSNFFLDNFRGYSNSSIIIRSMFCFNIKVIVYN